MNRYLLLLLTTIIAAGCDNSDSPPVPAGTSLFPAGDDDRWVYQVTHTTESDNYWFGVLLGKTVQTEEYEEIALIAGDCLIEGVPTRIQQFRDPGSHEVLETHFLHEDDSGVTERYAAGSTAYGEPLSSNLIVSYPLHVGDTLQTNHWPDVEIGIDVDSDGIKDRADVSWHVTVEGREAVSVPAGRFAGAWKIKSERRYLVHKSADGGSTSRVEQWTSWHVPGLGLVKRVGIPWSGGTYTHELARYHVGGVSNDRTPAAVTSYAPRTARNTAWPVVTLAFSETIDRGRLPGIHATLTDASGNSTDLAPYYEQGTLFLGAQEPLPAGTYTVRVENIFDYLGNRTPPHQHEFTVENIAPGDALNVFPIEAGNRWIYSVRKPDGNEALQADTLVTRRDEHGMDVIVKETREVATGNLLGSVILEETDTEFVVGVREPFSWTSAAAPASGRLHLPLVPTDRYVSEQWTGASTREDLDGDGQPETFDGERIVSVDADEFHADRPIVTMTDRRVLRYSLDGTLELHTSTTIERLVPGVGVIQREQTVSTPDGEQAFGWYLVGHVIGGERSETTAPVMVGRTPAAILGKQRLQEIVVEFSESLDIARVGAAAIRLLDAASNELPGTLTAQGNTLRFVPAQLPASGFYTIQVEGVHDLLGNQAPSSQWVVETDNTPPEVLAVVPPDGAANIPVDSDILLEFSEPVLFGSTPWNNVQIRGGPENTFSFRADGSRYSLRAPGGEKLILQHGTTYTVEVGTGVIDYSGNPLQSPYLYSFSTRPAFFEEEDVMALAAQVQDLAVGDLDGDGRQELAVLTASGSTADAGRLLVLTQRAADGALTTSASIVVSSSNDCEPRSLAIGDVTGNGRSDIVVGTTCGLSVFESDNTGNLLAGASRYSAASQHVSLVDINGDGRTDVVGGGQAAIATWLQQPDGTLRAGNRLTLPAGHRVVALDMGDLNGDGLPDAAFGRQDSSNRYAAVSYLQPSGTFGAPVQISILANEATLAIGDVNHDGRNDLVLDLQYFSGQPDGSLGASAALGSSSRPHAMGVADLDNDGDQDVFMAHRSGYASILLQSAEGGLSREDPYSITLPGDRPVIAAVGDINTDGRPDMIVGGLEGLRVLRQSVQ